MDIFQEIGVGWCIQADRRGNSDFVVSDWGGQHGTPNLCSWKFIGLVGGVALGKYGYRLSWTGTSTDVYTLSERGIGVSCVNVSAGYYGEHTKGEVVDIKEAYQCRDMVLECIRRYGSEHLENYRKPERYRRGGIGIDMEDWDDRYGLHSVAPSFKSASPQKHENTNNKTPFTLNGRYYTWNEKRKVWEFIELYSDSDSDSETESPGSAAVSKSLAQMSSLTPDLLDTLRRVDLGGDDVPNSE